MFSSRSVSLPYSNTPLPPNYYPITYHSQPPTRRLCDIALEELAFVVLARALAASGAGVDGEEGSAHFTGALSDPANAVAWTSSCAAVALGLRHVAMSAFRAG